MTTITIDAGLAEDLAAFRKARAVRMKAGAELFAAVSLPLAGAEETYRRLRDAELDAALDLACAVDARAKE